jgi:hypothetical protein
VDLPERDARRHLAASAPRLPAVVTRRRRENLVLSLRKSDNLLESCSTDQPLHTVTIVLTQESMGQMKSG